MTQTNPFELLVAEHGILRRHLGRALVMAQDSRSAAERRKALESFLAALRVHIRREEKALFPLCERLLGGPDSAISVLQEDHEAVGILAASLAREADARGHVDVDRLEELAHRLEGHFVREEKVLFPVAETRMTAAEAMFLARRLRAEPSA